MGSNFLCYEYYGDEYVSGCGGSVYWEQDDEFENFCCEGPEGQSAWTSCP